MATVTLAQVSKVYDGGVRAVDAIDLSIADGEFCVLVGPSGCGKSTTLRMVAGLEEITSGALAIDGARVNDLPAKDRDIAFVFQNYALYPHLTVAQNVAFGLEQRRAHGNPLRAMLTGQRDARVRESALIAERVSEVSSTLGLDALLARYPRELSGGQRQRVALGRAIARNPKVFLFDEPLSNLDARLRLETRTQLRLLHRRLRATIIYVTHDQEEAMTLADRLVVMHQGRVQQNSTAQIAYETPANRFVAGFIGTPPMNLLDGNFAHGTFEAPGVSLPLPARWPSLINQSKPCALGFRPDRVRIESAHAGTTQARDEAVINARVVAVERLGDRTDIALEHATNNAQGGLIARVNADDAEHIRDGDAVRVLMDTARVHLFEPGECGARISDR